MSIECLLYLLLFFTDFVFWTFDLSHNEGKERKAVRGIITPVLFYLLIITVFLLVVVLIGSVAFDIAGVLAFPCDEEMA